jgi:hypothetical protein
MLKPTVHPIPTMTAPILKVQLLGAVTTKSILNSPDLNLEDPLTFHAYSDTMKARILESLLKPETAGKIAVSITDEPARDGEWHEPLVDDSLLLK